MPFTDRVLSLERRFAASPERVWEAFTDAGAMTWMWGGMGSNPRADADPRPGGRYRVAIDEEPGKDGWGPAERAFEGVYAVVEPPARLVYTLHWDAPVGYNQTGRPVPDEVVVVELTGQGGATDLRMLHMGIPDDGASAREHEAGIVATFEHLARLVEGPE